MPDLVTTDIDNFWRAFDAADRLPAPDRARIFASAYYDTASVGMRDFIGLRLGDVERFERIVSHHDAYYRSARASTVRIREFEGEIRHFYKRFARLYPAVSIPRVTFVIGRLSCGGTTGPSGMLVGAEMFGRTHKMPTASLNDRHKAVIRPVSEIPAIVIHELVHVQQRVKGTSDRSLLANAVREGAAVVVTELVTRREDQTAPHAYGRLHESALWAEFQEEMRETDCSRWLGNGAKAGERPADLGYFVGAQVCRAFLDRVGDRREGVRRLLEAEDYEGVYEASGYGG